MVSSSGAGLYVTHSTTSVRTYYAIHVEGARCPNWMARPLLLLPQHTEGALPVLDPEFSQDC